MADENELMKLREELKKIQEGTRRSRRRAAFGFVILVFALIISFVYSFVQQVAATKNAEEALREHYIAEEQQAVAEKWEAETRRQMAIASEQRAVAVKAMLEARAAVERCEGKRNDGNVPITANTMANDNELIKLRDELKRIQEGTRRSRRRAAFGFVILVFALIISFAYSFVQQVAATKNAEEALRQQQVAEEQGKEAEANAVEAKRQQAIATEIYRSLEECRGQKK